MEEQHVRPLGMQPMICFCMRLNLELTNLAPWRPNFLSPCMQPWYPLLKAQPLEPGLSARGHLVSLAAIRSRRSVQTWGREVPRTGRRRKDTSHSSDYYVPSKLGWWTCGESKPFGFKSPCRMPRAMISGCWTRGIPRDGRHEYLNCCLQARHIVRHRHKRERRLSSMVVRSHF